MCANTSRSATGSHGWRAGDPRPSLDPPWSATPRAQRHRYHQSMMMGHGESEDQDPGISARLIAAVAEVPTLWELWLAVVRADSTPQSEAAKDAAGLEVAGLAVLEA